MKRLAYMMTLVLIAFSLAACGGAGKKPAETAAAVQESTEAAEETVTETEVIATETETGAANMINPVSEYETLGAAQRAAGVEIEIPEGPEGYPVTCYHAIKNIGLLEIVYLDGPANSEDSKEGYRVRKQAGEDDISGDYNEYSEIMEYEVEGGRIVTLKGNDGAIYCMTWTDGGYSYAVDIDMDGNGMPAYDALNLAAGIK